MARVPAWDGHARTEWDATEGSHTLSTDSCGHKDDIASHDAQLVACVAVSHPKGKQEHANEVESQPGLSCFPNGGPRTTKKANARRRTARERMSTPIKATHALDARDDNEPRAGSRVDLRHTGSISFPTHAGPAQPVENQGIRQKIGKVANQPESEMVPGAGVA